MIQYSRCGLCTSTSPAIGRAALCIAVHNRRIPGCRINSPVLLCRAGFFYLTNLVKVCYNTYKEKGMRLVVWVVLQLLKTITQGQGGVSVHVGYDSAIGEDSYNIHLNLERDGLILREPTYYSAWVCAGRIISLWKELGD